MAYLERLQKERGVSNIQSVVADAATLEPADRRVDSALVSMVLHHADDTPAILRNVARLLGPGGLAVVAEFHSEGPCGHGPPREHRLIPQQIETWCEATGFITLNQQRQTPEHYTMVLQRRA